MKTRIKDTLSRVGLLAAVIIIAGCDEDESFSRYPFLPVPAFGTDEYINDLSSTEPELVYNAICMLGPQADNFSRILNKEDADPASSEYQQAETAYLAVCREVESEEELLAAVSLHFLQDVASNHKNKEELMEVALRIQSDHPQVLYEQTVLLESVIEADSTLPNALLKELLNNRSWIISRTAYGLIGLLEDEPLRHELISRYQNTDDPRERLVIIDALGRQLQPEEARIFEVEMLSTTNALIRQTAMGVLICNLDVSGVRKSLVDHYADFTGKEQTDIFDECEDVDLACSFLEQGFVPTDKILESILKDLLNKEDKEPDLAKLERALSAAPQTAERWQALKDKAEQKRLKMSAAREEAKPMNKTVTDQMLALRDKHSLNDSELKEICNDLTKSMKALTEKQQCPN